MLEMSSKQKRIQELTDATRSIANGNYFIKINPNQYKYNDSELATAIENLQNQLISQTFEMQIASNEIDHSTAAMKELLIMQKKLVTDVYCASMDIENSYIETEADDITILKDNLAIINDSVAMLISNIKAITKMKLNLTNTSSSLHRMTANYKTDLTKEIKEKSNKIVADLTEYLLIALDNNPELALNIPDIHQEILDIIIDGSDRLVAIWTNDAQGNFIYSNPKAGLNSANIRDWFNECMKGIIYVSDIYISSISKCPCLTICLPIFDEDKTVKGVLGADVSVEY
jgi:methyl-accepting chemotaxis protein